MRWLFDLVKSREDLDFLIGANKTTEWISVYRGLSRVLTVKKSKKSEKIVIDGDKAYRSLQPDLFTEDILTIDFSDRIIKLINKIEECPKFRRYYSNMKEGYYQTELSRKHGICGTKDSSFVIIDKEAVIGYEDRIKKDEIFGEFQKSYKRLQADISKLNPERYGKDLSKKSIGNELDFLALDKCKFIAY